MFSCSFSLNIPRGICAGILKRMSTQEFGFPSTLTMSEVELEDPVEKIGAKLVRQAAAKTDDLTGDGTTTSMVLAQGPIAEGVKVVAAGANPALITRGIEKTAEDLRSKEEFEKMLKESKEFNKMFGPGDDSLSDNAVFKPFAFVGSSSNSKDKGMKSENFISGQRYVILRPKANVGQMNPKGKEKIAEEKACCILCFAKLAEGDGLLKSVCGCTNVPVHITCADTGIRKEGNICNYCGQEVHNEAVTLHRGITTT